MDATTNTRHVQGAAPNDAIESVRNEEQAGPEKSDADGNEHSPKTPQGSARKDAPGPAELEQPYSILTFRQKQVTVFVVSFVATISPLAGNIYYPAIPTLASDFAVSDSMIQLTITTYQVFQGITPIFIANFSDTHGRRPAYAICFVVFLAGNIGLALNSSYPGLLVLRCVQSAGSAATVSLGAGAVVDLVTRAERGRFISYAALGVTLGPVLAPVIGGLLTEYLGWRSVFWFLAIYALVIFPVYYIFVPETARNVVGNGSIRPKGLFMTPFQLMKTRRERHKVAPSIPEEQQAETEAAHKPAINPFLATVRILADRQGAAVVCFGALVYGGFFMVLTTLPIQLGDRFGLNAAQTGLCFLPIFVGTICSRWVAGRLLDWNYRRLARKHGVEPSRDREKVHLDDAVPIEAARLQICIPMIYLNAVCVLAYGWAMHSGQAPLAGIEVALFFLGIFNSGGLVGLGTLIMDIHPDSPATAAAANNLVRYLVSAGATAAAVPLIDRIGIGWTSVFIAGVWVCLSPLLWLVIIKGDAWRRRRREIQNDVVSSSIKETNEVTKHIKQQIDRDTSTKV